MTTIKLKVGRNILDIDKNDLILFNGACYQIITKRVRTSNPYADTSAEMSKKLFNDLRKLGLVFTSDNLKETAREWYGMQQMELWKFDVDRMKKLGY